MPVRASSANGKADERLGGMLQVLSRALDPAELRVSGPDGGPIPIAAVIANVQMALGMRRGDHARRVTHMPAIRAIARCLGINRPGPVGWLTE